MAYDTRQKLLDAAREIFLGRRWDRTTGVAIRKRAGVSHGSWKHFFPGAKAQIAAEIYQELHAYFWSDCLAAFGRSSAGGVKVTLRRALAALVDRLGAEPAKAALMLELESALLKTSVATVVRAIQAPDRLLVTRWYLEHPSGLREPLQGDVLHALIFGPMCAVVADYRPDLPGIPLRDLLERFTSGAAAALDYGGRAVPAPIKSQPAEGSGGGSLV